MVDTRRGETRWKISKKASGGRTGQLNHLARFRPVIVRVVRRGSLRSPIGR